MEFRDFRSIHSEHNHRRIQDSYQHSTSANAGPSSHGSKQQEGSCHSGLSGLPPGEGGYIQHSSLFPRILQSPFPSLKILRELETHYRPEPPQQVHTAGQHDSSHPIISQASNSSPFMGHPHRSSRCLLSYHHSQSQPSPSQIQVQRPSLPVQQAPIRPQIGPFHIYQNSKTSSSLSFRYGNKHFPISRRLAYRRRIRRTVQKPNNNGLRNTQELRFPHQPQVNHHPNTGPHLVGSGIELKSREILHPITKEDNHKARVRISPGYIGVPSRLLQVPHRETNLRGSVPPLRDPPPSTHPNVVHQERWPNSSGQNPSTSRSSGQVSIQNMELRPILRSNNGHITNLIPRSGLNHGCIKDGLGRFPKLRPNNPRPMASATVQKEYKSTRTASHLASNPRILTPIKIKNHHDQNRQLNSTVVSSETRRNKVLPFTSDFFQDSHNSSSKPMQDVSFPHSGQAKHQSRYVIQNDDHHLRMDSGSNHIQPINPKVGRTIDRPVCLTGQPPPKSILNHYGGCFYPQHKRGAPRLCLPSILSDNKISRTTEDSTVLPDNSNHPSLENSSMVPPTQENGVRIMEPARVRQAATASNDPNAENLGQPPEVPLSRLETLKTLVTRCDKDAILISCIESDKESTNELYERNFNTFSKWMRHHRYGLDKFNIFSLIEFINTLAEANRSFSTINNYKNSIIPIMLASKSCDAGDLSLLSRRMNKLKKVQQRRPVDTPMWDLDTVLDYLKSPKFEPLEEKDRSTILAKTMFLVIMAAGRRPSDMSGLCTKTREDWFIKGINKAVIKFHPTFRPKCRSHQFFPEPVSFSSLEHLQNISNSEKSLCPVRSIRLYLANSDDQRNHSLSYLFLHPSSGKNLLPSYISKCIKSLIIDAHRAGGKSMDRADVQTKHTRRVAASLAYHSGAPLDDVLRKAGWATPNCFINHYLLTKPLLPLNPVVAAGSAILPVQEDSEEDSD